MSLNDLAKQAVEERIARTEAAPVSATSDVHEFGAWFRANHSTLGGTPSMIAQAAWHAARAAPPQSTRPAEAASEALSTPLIAWDVWAMEKARDVMAPTYAGGAPQLQNAVHVALVEAMRFALHLPIQDDDVPVLTRGTTAIVDAWNALPNDLRLSPSLYRLFEAVKTCRDVDGGSPECFRCRGAINILDSALAAEAPQEAAQPDDVLHIDSRRVDGGWDVSTRFAQEAAQWQALPGLPESSDRWSEPSYTADQMRNYAHAAITWAAPEPKKYAPIYPDESREDQYAAARYVSGWNDCRAAFTAALAQKAQPAGDWSTLSDPGFGVPMAQPAQAPMVRRDLWQREVDALDNVRRVMRGWHEQAVALGYDGVAEVLDKLAAQAPSGAAELLKAWREECEAAPLSFLFGVKCLSLSEEALVRIGGLIEVLAATSTKGQPTGEAT